MHYKHTIHNKNKTSTIKLILTSRTNAFYTARGLVDTLIGTQHSYNYLYNMISVTVKTYVPNLLFTRLLTSFSIEQHVA
jgi:hypothetical protein